MSGLGSEGFNFDYELGQFILKNPYESPNDTLNVPVKWRPSTLLKLFDSFLLGAEKANELERMNIHIQNLYYNCEVSKNVQPKQISNGARNSGKDVQGPEVNKTEQGQKVKQE